MIKITVNAGGADGALRRLVLRVADREPINRKLAVQLQGHVFREFQTAGAFKGGTWAPLSEARAKWKAKRGWSAQPLLMTGHLRDSYLSFYDDRRAGVGSEVEYAPYHEEGGEHLPKRSVLPTEDEAREYAVAIYGLEIRRMAQEANQ